MWLLSYSNNIHTKFCENRSFISVVERTYIHAQHGEIISLLSFLRKEMY